MLYGLGIDTGGTYTDAVIYDFNNKKIVSVSKSITIKENLVQCISNTLNGLPAELLSKVSAVSLSTTLATNACIEGKGGRAKLILIGCDKKAAALYGNEYGLPPTEEIIFLSGGHNQKGNVTAIPDWDYLKKKIDECKQGIDSYAVVEIWGMNNSDFEKHTKNLLLEWTGKKVVCGNELTAKINLFKRAASALLNAQLIPLIGEFITAIKESLKEKGINAPIAIVRGDGSLMNEAFAMDRPVETLLCGPASSIEGGMNLTNEENCIIIDMGGTTSDMAIVKNKVPKLAEEGASVGKWRTGTRSILINTVGLGGDSRISFNSDSTINVGPGRVAPLSWAAVKWPGVKKKIGEIHNQKKKYFFPLCEFFYLTKDIEDDLFYGEDERLIAASLKNGPLNIEELAEKANQSLLLSNAKRLEKHGVISRIGLTPTDLMHIKGEFTGWDKEAAFWGTEYFASQIDLDIETFMENVYSKFKEKLFLNIAKTLIEDEDKSLLKDGMSEQLKEVLLNGFKKVMQMKIGGRIEKHNFFCNLTTPISLVGLGAPIHIFLPDIAAALGTTCIIPDNAHVANAIGAITGNIRTQKNVTIIPNYSSSGITGYIGFCGNVKGEFRKYSDAVVWAKEQAGIEAVKSAKAKGADDIKIVLNIYENEGKISTIYEKNKDVDNDRNSVLIETIITATAVGKPVWSGRN